MLERVQQGNIPARPAGAPEPSPPSAGRQQELEHRTRGFQPGYPDLHSDFPGSDSAAFKASGRQESAPERVDSKAQSLPPS